MTEYGKSLQANITTIPGLPVRDLPVHGDNRGWFKEDWQLATRDVDTIDQELRLLAAVRSRARELGGKASDGAGRPAPRRTLIGTAARHQADDGR